MYFKKDNIHQHRNVCLIENNINQCLAIHHDIDGRSVMADQCSRTQCKNYNKHFEL